MNKFRLKIVTPTTTSDQDVTSLSFFTESGSIGILANHLPIVTTIKPGKVIILSNNKKNEYNVSKGLFKFENNEALMLIEEMEEKK